MPVLTLLTLINLLNIIVRVEDRSNSVHTVWYFLLYPVMHLLVILFPLSSKLRRRSLPQVLSPSKSDLNMAVAQCNYEPLGDSAIRLVKCNKYHVLQEEDFAWWKVRDLEG